MIIQHRSSQTITSMIYEEYMKEQLEKMKDARNPRIVFVTDLVSCTHKFHLRHLFPELTLRFEPAAILGDLVHAGLEKILENRNIQVELPVEKKFKINGEEYILKGRIDGYDPSNKTVIEIKTSRTIQNLPREHHIYQLQIYLNLMDVDKGVLIYISPERILEYSIKREKIDLKTLMKLLIEDKVHPKWNWECRYCYFNKLCPYRASEQ